MARTEILPDGRAVLVPDDMTREEALALTGFAEAAPPPRADETKSDFIDDIQRGIGGLMSGAGSALRDVYEPVGSWLEQSGNQIVQNNPADYGSLSDIDSFGDLVGFGVERLAEMAPQLAGATAASVLGSPVAGAAVLGGTTGITTYGGARQAQREAGTTDYLRAAGAGLGAGALDLLGVGRILPGAGKVLGEVFEGGVRGAIRGGTKIAAEEAGTEVAQTALERFGGLQELASPEAMREYGFAAVSGGLVGGALGGARGAFGPSEVPAPGAEIEPPAVRTAPTGPLVPPGAPPELGTAPALRTIAVSQPSETGEMQPVSLSVLSEPDERGNVWVRTPEGRVSSLPAPILRRMAGEYVPQPVVTEAPAEAPATVPGETPGTFTTTTVINGVPVTTTGVTPTVEPPAAVPLETPAPAVAEAPVDVLPPEAPAVAPVAMPEAGPIGEAPAPTEAPLTTPLPQAEPTPIATAPASPAEVAVPEVPTITVPEAAPPPEPAPIPEPVPEKYTFTPEEANQLASHDAGLAKAMVGKTASGAATELAKRTTSPFYQQIATRVAGMAKAMESAGIRMPVGITATPGGVANVSEYTAKSASRPGVGGVTVSSPGTTTGPYNTFEVAMKGKPTKTVPSGANERTLLHELVHAVTTGAQRGVDRFPDSSRVGAALRQIKDLQKTVRQGVADIKSGKLQVDPEVQRALAYLENTNAFLNERELVAWGLTSYEMQTLLKAIPVKQGNAFTQFVKVIAQMLGVGPKDYNALRELIELTEVIIPEDAAAQQEVIDTVTGGLLKQGAPDTQAAIDEQAAPTEAEPETPPAAVNPQGRAYVQIPLKDESGMDKFRRIWADKLRRLGYVEENIEKATGHPLARTERATETAALFEGRAQERLDELQRDHLNKILDVMKREGITPNEADLFLLARAAFDRNAKIAKRNPNMPDGGSGLTNAEAQAILTEFVTSGRLAKMEALAAEVDALTAKTRDTMVKYGMLRQEQADALVRDEPFYVPLKGLAEDGDLSVSGDNVHRPPNSGRGFSISRKEFLATKGRSSLPFSPLANAMADAQAAIIRGERNRVGQSFLKNIAQKFDSNAWEVYTDENPEKQQIYNSKTGKVEIRPVQMELFPDRYFIVKEDGKPYYIKINDPLLMRALTNGSSKDFAAVNKVLGSTIGMATQALSRLHTTLNPEFFVPNFARDIEAAVFNILAEQDAVDGRLAGKKIVKDVLKDVKSIKNFRMLFKATFNHEATTNEQRNVNALFQQAKEDGAFTGWIMRETPESQMEKIKQELDRANATGKEKVWYDTQEKARGLFQKIQDFNSVFENVTRFAVYKNALKAGLTRDEAANMARNVTVDFNKKGEAGPTANALYAFFNAAVRGNAQLIRSLTAKSADGKYTRAQKLAMGMIAFGVLQTLIARGMSDEDEDGALFYDKIPDWEKQRNLIMMMPNGKEYIKIPLPYGYSFFHTLGTLGAEVGAGTKTMGDFGVGVISGLLNNFSPVPIGGESLSGIAASTVPTVLRPFADLMINGNFFGSPIYNEPFDENQAMSSVARYSTPSGYKAIVQFLNEATGGHGKVAGAVDLPAESLQYLINSYIGGAGKFGTDLVDLGSKTVSGRDMEMRNVPVLRKVLGEPSTQNDLGLYYDRLNEIQPIERQFRNSKGEERKLMRDKFPVETNPRVVMAMKEAQQQIKAVNKQKAALLDRDMDYGEQQDRLDKLNERQADIYLRFNRIYNQVKERED